MAQTLADRRASIAALTRAHEASAIAALLPGAKVTPEQRRHISLRAEALVASIRASGARGLGVEQFLHEYSLSTPEGVTLLGLAEAFLRIPDSATADALIRDKLGAGDWESHRGKSPSALVNASTVALTLTRHLLGETAGDGVVARLMAAGGEPLLRRAVAAAMRIMGGQFVLGRTIEEALDNARDAESRGFSHSYDMLGEGARTAADAERYFTAYRDAIAVIGSSGQKGDIHRRPNISVKLSALHPRYEPSKAAMVRGQLVERLLALAVAARDAGIGLTVDAEEADRLELSLEIIEAVAIDAAIAGWDGFGLAVQAYQKRARPVIDWAESLGAAANRRLMVRLVKGAYWDSEIKRAQERGLDGYPVFTRKAATDVSFLGCARALLESPHVYPAFATHNALSVATVLEWIGTRRDLEFQRLHGMGEGLYERLIADEHISCRIYAPVGVHRDLLAYLVRRLLENGANTSFVHRVSDPNVPMSLLIADPTEAVARVHGAPHPHIPLPRHIYGAERSNSRGIDLADSATVARLTTEMASAWTNAYTAAPLIDGREAGGANRPVLDPANRRRVVGEVIEATPALVAKAVESAARAAESWSARAVEERAACLDRMADLLDGDRVALMALAVCEAGKTIPDALAEVREAVDYCRYYAAEARRRLAPQPLPGPTGEANKLLMAGRGVFGCISPWNFPLAIFLGQITAALVAGNAVVAKPAPQTPLIAARAVRLLHKAGVPADVLHLMPGGADVGESLVAHPQLRGVAFTGSTRAAHAIAEALADKPGPIVPLIAETGGINAMIVDSSALPERVIDDVVTSAFQSAGQRCSALRILYLQDDTADQVLDMLKGAMEELVVGDPERIETDVGPVIDEAARARLQTWLDSGIGTILHARALSPDCTAGWFMAPHLVALDSPAKLREEVFGPILHVVRWNADRLDEVVDAINATDYGLTLGIHTRIGATVERVRARARVGNIYVNRSMIGAVVGVQPFGGEGLSGTGPKAGGPHYLPRFAVERTVSVDTTVAGGNASLLAIEDPD
ncbi:MAG TPA: bifunctional proline dehydrogenase/L-glutamate gamma-semialdehyde dehydrogenase PutA [Alphaproteobacteria bacterium]|nr:bifunctional proline dehydrogenase/L-glutamate gamma-semialdehyde dehydrogenase PutA [Alphaproteobacteria bacterium]